MSTSAREFFSGGRWEVGEKHLSSISQGATFEGMNLQELSERGNFYLFIFSFKCNYHWRRNFTTRELNTFL